MTERAGGKASSAKRKVRGAEKVASVASSASEAEAEQRPRRACSDSVSLVATRVIILLRMPSS
jgi:hypothetical protein